MSREELDNIMGFLDLTQQKFSEIIGVNITTVRRWFKYPDKMTMAAQHTLRAWEKLHRLTLPWRPGDIDLAPGVDDFVRNYLKTKEFRNGRRV